MAANPIFELFEVICAELAGRDSVVISEDKIEDGLMEEVMGHLKETSETAAFKLALRQIDEHFSQRNAVLPFSVVLSTRTFTVTDAEYIEFIAFAKNNRGVGGDESKAFEQNTLKRLRKRLTGDLRRVGSPRTRHNTRAALVSYLEKLGFEENCLKAHDKDGGLDILWLPPLGAIPMRPVASVQCKNGYANEMEAHKSNGRASRTLGFHQHQKKEQLRFVVFNDYVDESLTAKLTACSFHPLGLTDLASLRDGGIDDVL